MSINRGEVYWDHFKDATGRDRKVPLLVMSADSYNRDAMFVTGVRLVQFDNRPCAQHVHIPASAFQKTMVMGDCVALCETLSSIRQTSLSGPIAIITDEYMTAVENGVRMQLGMDGKTTTGRNEFHTYNTTYNATYNANWLKEGGGEK